MPKATIDYEKATSLLKELFATAEAKFYAHEIPAVSSEITHASTTLFASKTQAYREALLGCGVASLLDNSIDIRQPYVGHGEGSFNGRTLDEKVINPFLQEKLIPCSKGPYLASFRRSVKFLPATAKGLRDKKGFSAMLDYIAALQTASDDQAHLLVLNLLYRFVELRDQTNIPLSRISRLSLQQYRTLITKLLRAESGGLVPVLLVVALLKTINGCFGLSWSIDWQGINVSDKASGASGDITVTQGGTVLLAIEVTERPIGRDRVVSTFNTKILSAGIQDYLFVYADHAPSEDARSAAQTYFSQGHEINFLKVDEWIVNNLGTVGAKCREIFTREALILLGKPSVPVKIKLAWNEIVQGLLTP